MMEMMKESTAFARRVGAKLVIVIDSDNRASIVTNFNEPVGPEIVRAAAGVRDDFLPLLEAYTAALWS